MLAFLVIVSLVITHSHNTPKYSLQTANTSSNSSPASTPSSSSTSTPVVSTPAVIVPSPVVATPQQPSKLTSSDQETYTNTLNNFQDLSGDLSISNTSTTLAQFAQQDVSNNMEQVKLIDIGTYTPLTQSDINEINSDLSSAYNEYSQALTDASNYIQANAAAQSSLGNSAESSLYETYQSEATSDQSQKELATMQGNSDISSAKLTLDNIEQL